MSSLETASMIACIVLVSVSIWIYFKRKYREKTAAVTSIMDAEVSVELKKFNPLSELSFDEFLDPLICNERVVSNAMSWMKNSFGDAGALFIQGLAAKELDSSLLARFSKSTAEKLSKGAASLMRSDSGIRLTAIEQGSKKIIENAEKADPSFLIKASQLGPAIVGVAHIVSNHDNAKKLKRIEEQIDLIVQLRSLDQKAELQSLFEGIKHECSLGEMRSSDRIKDYRDRLRKLRITQIHEIKGALGKVKNWKTRGYLKHRFSKKKKMHSIEQDLKVELFKLREIQSIIQLEQIVHLILNESPSYIIVGVPETVAGLQEIRLVAKSKLDSIPKNMTKDTINLESIVPGIISLIGFDDNDAA